MFYPWMTPEKKPTPAEDRPYAPPPVPPCPSHEDEPDGYGYREPPGDDQVEPDTTKRGGIIIHPDGTTEDL